MKTEVATTDDVVLDVDLPHAPETVWRALTEADLVGRWLMATGLRAEVGSRFHLPASDGDAKAPPVTCEVIEAVPNRKLQWRQLERESAENARAVESIVTLQLVASPLGTRLRIVHDRFRDVSLQRYDNIVSLANRRRLRSPKITSILSGLRLAA